MLTIRANADYCLQDGKMEVRALRTIHPEEEVCLCWFWWCWYFSWCWRLGIWWRCRRSRRLWTRLKTVGKNKISYDHHSKHCRLPFATPTFWKRTAPSQGEREKLTFCGHIGWSVQIEYWWWGWQLRLIYDVDVYDVQVEVSVDVSVDVDVDVKCWFFCRFECTCEDCRLTGAPAKVRYGSLSTKESYYHRQVI